MNSLGELTFFCGKMGAGKSTKSEEIARTINGVLLSEDDWLAAHYPNEINNFDDYLTYSSRIKPFVKRFVQNLLKSGCDVVMDFPANTRRQRLWFKELCDEIGCAHQMFYMNLPDAVCLQQIEKRRIEQPARAHFDNEATFHYVTQFFEAPEDDEDLTIVEVIGFAES